MDYRHSLIFTAPSPHERRVAIAIGVAAFCCALLITPVRHAATAASAPVITLLYATYVAAGALTAWMLRNQFRASGFAPLAVLAAGHAYGAAVIAAYLLTFPHVFSASGLLGAGPQTSAWLWLAAHAGFVCFAFLYIIVHRRSGDVGALPDRRFILATTAGTALAVAAVVGIATIGHDRLPVVILRNVTYAPLLVRGIAPLLIAAYVLAFLLNSALHRKTVTNLWLGVVIVALCGDVTVGGVLSGARFTWGWYLGHAEGAIASLTFLVVMLRQTSEVLVAYAASNRQLAETTVRDHLTALLNRRGYEQRIAEVFRHTGHSRMPVALLMVDVDDFKRYNDHFGHVLGDRALQNIGRVIVDATSRLHDACCRVGGEEFAVVLPGADEQGALMVGERICAAIAGLRIPQAPEVATRVLTASVGVASTSGQGACNEQGLYLRADTALYAAKRLGRNRVIGYSALAQEAPRELSGVAVPL